VIVKAPTVKREERRRLPVFDGLKRRSNSVPQLAKFACGSAVKISPGRGSDDGAGASATPAWGTSTRQG
jgi:hypothetical protein